jgi:hypothetical protein
MCLCNHAVGCLGFVGVYHEIAGIVVLQKVCYLPEGSAANTHEVKEDLTVHLSMHINPRERE